MERNEHVGPTSGSEELQSNPDPEWIIILWPRRQHNTSQNIAPSQQGTILVGYKLVVFRVLDIKCSANLAHPAVPGQAGR